MLINTDHGNDHLLLISAQCDQVLYLPGAGVEDLDHVPGGAPDVATDHHHLPHRSGACPHTQTLETCLVPDTVYTQDTK